MHVETALDTTCDSAHLFVYAASKLAFMFSERHTYYNSCTKEAYQSYAT